MLVHKPNGLNVLICRPHCGVASLSAAQRLLLAVKDVRSPPQTSRWECSRRHHPATVVPLVGTDALITTWLDGESFGSGSTFNTGYTHVQPLLHNFKIRYALPTAPTQETHALSTSSKMSTPVALVHLRCANMGVRGVASKQLTKSHVSTSRYILTFFPVACTDCGA